jgi:hypothetical protein
VDRLVDPAKNNSESERTMTQQFQGFFQWDKHHGFARNNLPPPLINGL